MSDAFEEENSFIVFLNLDGLDYSGEASWTSEDGFIANLEGYFDGSFARPDQIPELLPIEIGKGKRALLVKPTLSRLGNLRMSVGRPTISSIQVRSDTVIHGMKWEIPASLRLQKIEVECEALRLWYGDETAIVDTNYQTQETTALFRTSTQEYETAVGKLEISLGYTSPGWPKKGKYHFTTSVGALLAFEDCIRVTELSLWAERIENFFDIFSAFPPSRKRLRIWLEGHENGLEVSYRNLLRGGGGDDHPHCIFLDHLSDIDVSAAFDAYLDQYDALRLLQDTTRYLSNKTIRVPEGFLTACNLIEALGSNGAVADQTRLEAAVHINELIGKNPGYKKSWSIIDGSLLKQPSFVSKYRVVAERSKELGCPVSLEAGRVRDVRAKYRHDLRQLHQDDLIIMQAFVGFAWMMGLVELCEKIGIGKPIISQALSKEVFHLQRNTCISLWSREFSDVRRERIDGPVSDG